MSKEMLIDKHGLGHAVAIMEKSELIDLFIDPIDCDVSYPPGSILRATISRKIDKRGGYFIRLPNKKEGFLVSKNDYKVKECVKVLAKPFFEQDKAQRFSDKLKVETKYFIIEKGNGKIFYSKNFSNNKLRNFINTQIQTRLNESGKNISVIFRSSLNNVKETKLDEIFSLSVSSFQKQIDEIDKFNSKNLGLLAKGKAINFYGFEEDLKITEEDGVFELRGIWDKIENLCKKKFLFGKKSYLLIEQTSAFCAIDVNSGGDLKISSANVNLEACHSIIYNIKLRGLGGKIIIDFLPCSMRDKIEIEKKITLALQKCQSGFTIFGWTKGNNFEIEGARNKIPLNLVVNL